MSMSDNTKSLAKNQSVFYTQPASSDGRFPNGLFCCFFLYRGGTMQRDGRKMVQYKDLDAPEDMDFF